MEMQAAGLNREVDDDDDAMEMQELVPIGTFNIPVLVLLITIMDVVLHIFTYIHW